MPWPSLARCAGLLQLGLDKMEAGSGAWANFGMFGRPARGGRGPESDLLLELL